MKNYLEQHIVSIKEYLEEYTNSYDKEISEVISYSLLGNSKFIRSFIMCHLATRKGIKTETIMPFAAAIEMIHTYTLIHDDLPCMDNDDYRRGKFSNHKVYGESSAVLAGDALQSDAFNLMSQSHPSVSDFLRLKIINMISDYIGTNKLVLGQFLDLKYKNYDAIKSLGQTELLSISNKVNTLKTSYLIKASFLIPYLISNANANIIEQVKKVGELLGSSYQIVDDMKDKHDNNFNIVRLIGVTKANHLLNENYEKVKQIALDIDSPVLEELYSFIIKTTQEEK